jgi:hypothetical protein
MSESLLVVRSVNVEEELVERRMKSPSCIEYGEKDDNEVRVGKAR